MKKKKEYKFRVVVTCQGHTMHYPCKTLLGALFIYAHKYLKYNKYGTMNFKLEQIFW